MKRLVLALIGCWLVGLGWSARAAADASPSTAREEQTLAEQKHFVECLSLVYSPGWWFSYNDSLYFQARTEARLKLLEAMRAARSHYVALTNQEVRYALAARIMAESGVSESWQKKLLLPFSAANQTLTPTLDQAVRVIPKYTVLQALPSGDALIQDGATNTYFVMNFGRAPDDAARTNALLVWVGVKTFLAEGQVTHVAAFTDVGLSQAETTVLSRVAAAFQKEAAALAQKLSVLKYGEEFESNKARANDSNPYFEFLLAKAYLEGRGTEKNEALGREWMSRAARSGSGDAQAYLDAQRRKAP